MTVDAPQSAIEIFQSLLASDDGRRIFADSVLQAIKENIHKSPFNVDSLTYLSAGLEACKYAEANMREIPRFGHKTALLDYAVDAIKIDGPVLEFGVFSGESINRIADKMPDARIFGFDSFEGLPEPWLGWPKGLFNKHGSMPDVRKNVRLIAGWFDHVLPNFLDETKFDQVSLLHIDCDLYSSTQTVFALLHERIKPGTIILFDEYMNFPSWERNEIQAFKEYVRIKNRKYEYIGLVPGGEQVAARVLK